MSLEYLNFFNEGNEAFCNLAYQTDMEVKSKCEINLVTDFCVRI